MVSSTSSVPENVGRGSSDVSSLLEISKLNLEKGSTDREQSSLATAGSGNTSHHILWEPVEWACCMLNAGSVAEFPRRWGNIVVSVIVNLGTKGSQQETMRGLFKRFCCIKVWHSPLPFSAFIHTQSNPTIQSILPFFSHFLRGEFLVLLESIIAITSLLTSYL